MGDYNDDFPTTLDRHELVDLIDEAAGVEDRILKKKAIRATVSRPSAAGTGAGLISTAAGAKRVPDEERKALYEASVQAAKGVTTSCPWCLAPMVKERATFCKTKCKTRFHNWRRAFQRFEGAEILDPDEGLVELRGMGRHIYIR